LHVEIKLCSMNYIRRDIYLQKLVNRMNNSFVKIITGPRRSGKSWLLSRIFTDYLLQNGVTERQIISLSFEKDDENDNRDLLSSSALRAYLYERMADKSLNYYVFLDEIQEVEDFERIVNGLAAKENVDVYVTGSNSRFLSSDINTIFRGRGDEVRVWPFTFSEFVQERDESINELWKEYYTYGGMPALRMLRTAEQKTNYLQRLWSKVYLDDVVERNGIKNRGVLESLADTLCSSVGSLTNPSRISNTINSTLGQKVSTPTVDSYIDCLVNAFLFEGAKRYDIKGRRYFGSISKYYSIDIGLRNARLNFRQQEPTHIMENVIYNELRVRGYTVDVGVIEGRRMENGRNMSVQYEVDFIAKNGMDKYYIQSAYHIDTEEKRRQELASLLKIDESFRKIVVTADDLPAYTDEHGIVFVGLFDFLMGRCL